MRAVASSSPLAASVACFSARSSPCSARPIAFAWRSPAAWWSVAALPDCDAVAIWPASWRSSASTSAARSLTLARFPPSWASAASRACCCSSFTAWSAWRLSLLASVNWSLAQLWASTSQPETSPSLAMPCSTCNWTRGSVGSERPGDSFLESRKRHTLAVSQASPPALTKPLSSSARPLSLPSAKSPRSQRVRWGPTSRSAWASASMAFLPCTADTSRVMCCPSSQVRRTLADLGRAEAGPRYSPAFWPVLRDRPLRPAVMSSSLVDLPEPLGPAKISQPVKWTVPV